MAPSSPSPSRIVVAGAAGTRMSQLVPPRPVRLISVPGGKVGYRLGKLGPSPQGLRLGVRGRQPARAVQADTYSRRGQGVDHLCAFRFVGPAAPVQRAQHVGRQQEQLLPRLKRFLVPASQLRRRGCRAVTGSQRVEKSRQAPLDTSPLSQLISAEAVHLVTAQPKLAVLGDHPGIPAGIGAAGGAGAAKIGAGFSGKP